MAVFRVEKTRDYTIMSNYHLKEKNLTLKSKGLLSLILSLPDEWNYTTRGLAAICKEGVDSIGAALRELEGAGYIMRRRLRDAKGKITDTEYIIYERPQKPDTDDPCPGTPDTNQPYTENPDMGRPDMAAPSMADPCTEKTAQLNTNGSSTHQSSPYKSNTHGSTIHPSIYPASEAPLHARCGGSDAIDRMDAAYRDLIMENIEYDILAQQYGRERLDEIVELILETVLSKRDFIRIAGDDYPREVVKSRLLKITSQHVEYVFDCLDKNTTKVRSIKAYLLTALYNAPATIDSYYRAEVQHDLYGGDF